MTPYLRPFRINALGMSNFYSLYTLDIVLPYTPYTPVKFLFVYSSLFLSYSRPSLLPEVAVTIHNISTIRTIDEEARTKRSENPLQQEIRV